MWIRRSYNASAKGLLLRFLIVFALKASRRWPLVLPGILVAIGLMGPHVSSAQSASAPVFEVVSIKPQQWTGQGGVGVLVRGNTLDAEHISLFSLD